MYRMNGIEVLGRGILELGEFEVSRVLVLFTEEIKHHRIGFTVKVFNLE